ncbi:MAG: tellurite resistance TerB family protein [Caulobacter sp.]
MGLFSGLLGRGADETLDTSTAVMVPMVAAMLADGDIADEELRQIRSICVWSPLYASNSSERDTEIIRRAMRLVQDLGADVICERVRATLSPALRETAFIFAVRLVFSDAHLGAAEQALIEKLVTWLGLAEDRARLLIEAVSIMQHTADA